MVLGQEGVHGIVPKGTGDQMIRVREVPVSGSSQTAYRTTMPCAIVVQKQTGISRLKFRPRPETL
jgi:hypothetical protein